jgi:two-component sensor histidine kinase
MSLGFVRRAMYTLADYCGPDVAETLALVFSELMTNAIRHSGVPENDPLDVELEIGHSIRGGVSDRGPGFEPGGHSRLPSAEGGFGLRIVDRLAKKWGVERSDTRSTVWFEL